MTHTTSKLSKKERLVKNILKVDVIRSRRALITQIDSYKFEHSIDSKNLSNLKKLISQWNKKGINRTDLLDQLSTQVAELASSEESIHVSVSHCTVVMPRIFHRLQDSFNQLTKLKSHVLPKQEVEAIIASRLRDWITAIAEVRHHFLMLHQDTFTALERYPVKKKPTSDYLEEKNKALIGLKTVLNEIHEINTETTSKSISKMIHFIITLEEHLDKATRTENASNSFFSKNHQGGKIGLIMHHGLGKIMKILCGFRDFLNRREAAINADKIAQEAKPIKSLPAASMTKLTRASWSPIYFQPTIAEPDKIEISQIKIQFPKEEIKKMSC